MCHVLNCANNIQIFGSKLQRFRTFFGQVWDGNEFGWSGIASVALPLPLKPIYYCDKHQYKDGNHHAAMRRSTKARTKEEIQLLSILGYIRDHPNPKPLPRALRQKIA